SMNQAVGTVDPGYAYSGGHRGPPDLPTNGPWLTGNYGQNNNARGPFATYAKTDHFPVTPPSKIFLLADEAPLSINDAGMATSADLNNRKFVDFPSFLHNHGCSFSFCDGHVEMHRWLGSAIILANGASFVSTIRTPGDIADFNWLATHSSVK